MLQVNLFNLLINARAWPLGPMYFEGTHGDSGYLQGLYTGLDFIIGKLLRTEEMDLNDVLHLHKDIRDESPRVSYRLSRIEYIPTEAGATFTD